MNRKLFVFAHRHVGLGMTVFLTLAGLTGVYFNVTDEVFKPVLNVFNPRDRTVDVNPFSPNIAAGIVKRVV